MEGKDNGEILIGKGAEGNDSDLFYGIITPLACMDQERNTITFFNTQRGFGAENQLGKLKNTDI